MRKIQIVPMIKIEEMRNVFNEYLTELSNFDPEIKFNKFGLPIYKWFDYYWEEKSRYPFYLLINEKIAGLALIRELDNMSYEIAEFYVKPEFRKDGNAIWFATEITNLFDGQFVFSTKCTNPRAIIFWDKFVNMFSSNEHTDDNLWRNWIIRKNSFNTHTLNLNPKYFELIKSGKKILEGRLNDEKRQKFNVGDKIIFYKEPQRTEEQTAVITGKYLFNSFVDMANQLEKADLGFENESKEEMINCYHQFYSKEDENKYGVVIFRVKLID